MGHLLLKQARIPKFRHLGMVRTAGLEPARSFDHLVLSQARMPFRHVRKVPGDGIEPPTLCV